MKILQDYRALAKLARVCAYISAASIVLWALLTALLMILDSLTFGDPRIAEIRSWPLFLVYAVMDDTSENLEEMSEAARDDPMWYTRERQRQ